MNQEINILLRNGFMPMPKGTSPEDKSLEKLAAVATVGMNIAYYGFALNESGFSNLRNMSADQLSSWWQMVEPELKDITGESKNMGDFVVYKNFPKEVLSKDKATYWIAQLCMYAGYPKEFFTEDVEPREGMKEQPPLKVLHMSNPLTLDGILNNLLCHSSRWKNEQLQDVIFLSENREVDFSRIVFKENLVNLCKFFVSKGRSVKVKNATDVLRLAAGLSDGDTSLREKVYFRRFKRSERRFFLNIMEECKNIEEDFARRPEVWKRLVSRLHPGDYKGAYPSVVQAYNKLYNGELQTFNSSVEEMIKYKNKGVLALLKTRPGDFTRRIVHLIDVFGMDAAKSFSSDEVLHNLTNYQLVSIRRFLSTYNSRKTRVFPPRGNWSKLKVEPIRKMTRKQKAFDHVISAISSEMKERFAKIGPKVLDPQTDLIKLDTNDGEVSPYSRGTVFKIPDNIKFIRTASYWKSPGRTIWFDNGWNFFREDWKPANDYLAQSACCWNATRFGSGKVKDAAIFSGDPVSGGEMQGRAAQMIDLYLDKLEAAGVRYAVWNVLCYSKVKFSEVEEVYAALQWGEEPQNGKLFEPSRCQLSFPLSGDGLTKYVCYIDIKKREMVYMDANLRGDVQSAIRNTSALSAQMPAFVEYLNSIPSVYDLFSGVEKEDGNNFVLCSDKDVELNGERAYVFKPENENNKFHKIELADILSMKRFDMVG